MNLKINSLSKKSSSKVKTISLILLGFLIGITISSIYPLNYNLPILPITRLVDDLQNVTPIFAKIENNWVYLNSNFGLYAPTLWISGNTWIYGVLNLYNDLNLNNHNIKNVNNLYAKNIDVNTLKTSKIYDKDNTNYYVDPSNSATSIKVAGDIYVKTNQKVATENYVQSYTYSKTEADNRFVNVNGDTMSGDLNMNGNDITNVNSLSANKVEANEVCLNGSCKTSWPNGGNCSIEEQIVEKQTKAYWYCDGSSWPSLSATVTCPPGWTSVSVVRGSCSGACGAYIADERMNSDGSVTVVCKPRWGVSYGYVYATARVKCIRIVCT